MSLYISQQLQSLQQTGDGSLSAEPPASPMSALAAARAALQLADQADDEIQQAFAGDQTRSYTPSTASSRYSPLAQQVMKRCATAADLTRLPKSSVVRAQSAPVFYPKTQRRSNSSSSSYSPVAREAMLRCAESKRREELEYSSKLRLIEQAIEENNEDQIISGLAQINLTEEGCANLLTKCLDREPPLQSAFMFRQILWNLQRQYRPDNKKVEDVFLQALCSRCSERFLFDETIQDAVNKLTEVEV